MNNKDKIIGGQVLPLYCCSQSIALNKMDEFSFGFVLLLKDYYHLDLIQKIVDKDMSSLQLSAFEEDDLLLQLSSGSLDAELTPSNSRMHQANGVSFLSSAN